MSSLKILIVDDVLVMRKALRMLVAEYDHEYFIMEASDAAEAILLYEQTKPDIVFLDILMPGRTGKEVLKDILEIDPLAKVIMFSGSNDKLSVMDCIRSGAKDYVIKPPSVERVHKALDKITGKISSGAQGHDDDNGLSKDMKIPSF